MLFCFVICREDNIKEKRLKFKEIFGHSPDAKVTLAKKSRVKKQKSIPVGPFRRSGRHKNSDTETNPLTLENTVKSPLKEEQSEQSEKKEASALSSEVSASAAVNKKMDHFKCTVCEKTFAFRNSMLKHKVSVHSDELYLCDICNKSFAYKDSVLRHKQVAHTESKMFGCNFCAITFKYKQNVKAHCLKYHPNEQ